MTDKKISELTTATAAATDLIPVKRNDGSNAAVTADSVASLAAGTPSVADALFGDFVAALADQPTLARGLAAPGTLFFMKNAFRMGLD